MSIILFTVVGYVQIINLKGNVIQAKNESGSYEAVITNFKTEEFEKIKNNVLVESVGLFKELSNEKVFFQNVEKDIIISALDEVCFNEMFNNFLTLRTGRLPQNSGEVIVDIAYKDQLKYSVGKEITLDDKVYTIVGEYDKNSVYGSYDINYLTRFDSLLGADKANLAIILKSNKKFAESLNNILSNIDRDSDSEIIYNHVLLYWYGEAIEYPTFNVANIGTTIFLYLVLMTLMILFIYSSTNVSIRERMDQFSILRCMGATPWKIKLLIMKESLFLLLFSLIPGIIIGQGVCFIVTKVLFNRGFYLETGVLNYRFYPGLVLLVCVLAVVGIMIATLIPIYKINRISPIQALIMNGNKKSKARKVKSSFIRKRLGYDWELAYKNIVWNGKNFIIATIISVTILSSCIIMSGYFELLDKETKLRWETDKDASIRISSQDNTEDELAMQEKYKTEIEELKIADDITSRMSFYVKGIFKNTILDKRVNEIDSYNEYGAFQFEKENTNYVYSNSVYIEVYEDDAFNELLEKADIKTNDTEDGALIVKNLNVLNNISGCKSISVDNGNEFELFVEKNIINSDAYELEEEANMILEKENKLKFKYLGEIDNKYIIDSGKVGYFNSITIILSNKYYNKHIETIKEIRQADSLDRTVYNYNISLNNEFNNLNYNTILNNYSKRIEGDYFNLKETYLTQINQISVMYAAVYTSMILIIIVGAIHTINNKFINIKTREKEIGIYLAVGVNKDRLNKIYILEGIMQWLISTVVSLLISSVIIYMIAYFFDINIFVNKTCLIAILGVMILFIINYLGYYIPVNRIKKVNTIDLLRDNRRKGS